MWRPDGWDSESVVIAVYQELRTESTDEKERKLVEAGADAILKALKNKTNLGKCCIPSLGFGWMVFIPDDEKENK